MGCAAGISRSFSAGNLRVQVGGAGEGAPGSPQRPNFAWCLVEDSCDLAPAVSSQSLTLHGKLYLALAPVPSPHHSLSSLKKKKKIKKKPLKKSMFPNLHEIFYHMMCLAFRK